MWLPRKFIDYSSCHTHYTKWYMFKGLLIRTLTICNSQEDFMKGVIHYAQGLIARGFPVTAIKRAWNKFIYEKIQQPAVRHKLTEDLLSWLRKQDFSGAFPDEESKKEEQKKKNKCLKHYEGTLMCGLVALNHILRALKLPAVASKEMQQIAKQMADKEISMLYSSSAQNMELEQLTHWFTH